MYEKVLVLSRREVSGFKEEFYFNGVSFIIFYFPLDRDLSGILSVEMGRLKY